MANAKRITLDRRKAVARVLRDRGDALLITGLGAPSFDAMAAGDSLNNFYVWSGMGSAVPFGLGLACAQPGRRVLTVTGDGEMLMGLGSLATVAVQRPANFAVVVIDNQRYGETGGQLTHTEFGVDIPAMAKGAGFRTVATVYTNAELEEAVPLILTGEGPVFVSIKVRPEPAKIVLPPRDGPMMRHRFRANLLGEG
jgi:thiamine pyrophosphate-dependent acetolactate synthase large subunit-like protein